jgi:hypothetical protein
LITSETSGFKVLHLLKDYIGFKRDVLLVRGRAWLLMDEVGGSLDISLVEKLACSTMAYTSNGEHSWRFAPQLKELILIALPPGESARPTYPHPDGSSTYLLESNEDLLESVSQGRPGATSDIAAFRRKRSYYRA